MTEERIQELREEIDLISSEISESVDLTEVILHQYDFNVPDEGFEHIYRSSRTLVGVLFDRMNLELKKLQDFVGKLITRV